MKKPLSMTIPLFRNTSTTHWRATASLHEQQEQRNNEHWCSGVPATIELRQAKKWNTCSYPVWVQGKKTGKDMDRVHTKQELQTCWSKWMRIGLESDVATKCGGNRIRDVSYGTAAVHSEAHGHLCGVQEERGRELRVPYRPRVMNIWTARWCAGKLNEIERTEIERIMLRCKFNVFYRVQVLPIYKIDYTATSGKFWIYLGTLKHAYCGLKTFLSPIKPKITKPEAAWPGLG